MANNEELSIDRVHELCMAENLQDMEGNVDYVLNEKLLSSTEYLYATECFDQDFNSKQIEKGEDWANIPIWFEVPQTVISFTGREVELEVVADNMKNGIVVVCGLRGVGKSELVAKYARSQCNERYSVVWIDATTRDSTVRSFSRLATEKLDISVKGKSERLMLDEVYKHLNSDECLLIFDNAENYSSLEEFLPFTSLDGYFILITSPNALDWRPESRMVKVLPPLSGFNKMEATIFVKRIMEISTDDNAQNETIEILVEKLHYFPPLINIITEYIKKEDVMHMKRNSKFKITDYLKLLENSHTKQKVMLAELISNSWQATAGKIEVEECGQDAMDTLNIIAYFESNNIPAEVLADIVPRGDQSCLSKALTLIQKYCIINLDNGMIAIQGLIQEAVRFNNCKSEEEILKKGLTLFKDHVTTDKSVEGCVPHIISLWRYAMKYDRLIESYIINDKTNSTYFHLIAESCSYVVVKTLVESIEKQHPDKLLDVLNERDKKGQMALHYAIRGGNEGTISLLIETGADVNPCNNFRYTPLHLAAMYGLDAVVQALLGKGAEVKSVTNDKSKLTALHLATQKGYKLVVEYLLKNSADVNARSLNELTALHLASQNGHVGIVSLLLKHSDVEIEAKNGEELTALHLAAQGGHQRAVRVLLINSAYINALNMDHFTPLHLAAQHGRVDVVNELLYNHKVCIDAHTKQGNTPFHLAAENGHLDVVKALFENNCNSELINLNGKTALNLAELKKHSHIEEFIQRRLTLGLSELKPENLDRTYKKIATSIDGHLYEIRLVTLLLLTGFTREVHNFTLASNMKQGYKLSDIVFKCYYYGKQVPKLLFLQAIHKNDPKEKKDIQGGSAEKNKITISHLFPDSESQNSDFSVLRYFDSYLKIRKEFSVSKVKDPIFCSRYCELDCEFVVYTNAQAAFNSDANCIGEPMVGFERVLVEKNHVLHFSIEEATRPCVYYKIIPGRNEYLDEKIDTLKQVSKSEADITEFFNAFKLFVGQPNIRELSEIIKCSIQHKYRVGDEIIPTVFPVVESRVLKWRNEEDYHLTKDNRFLHDAMRINIKFDVQEPVLLFTGRVEMLMDLHETLQKEGSTVVSHAASVTGLGGVGKSELARKYISIYSSDYDGNILWINASSNLTIDMSFRRLAKDIIKIETKDQNDQELNIEMIIAEVYKYFAERQRRSLFIFDNAEKYQTVERFDDSLDKFLPTGPYKPHVLITSQDQEWGNIKMLPLDIFTEPEAVAFILKSLNFGSQVDVKEVKNLAEQLQYFPLALQQAVAYIQRENNAVQSSLKLFTIADYLVEYDTGAVDLIQESSNGMQDRYSGTVFTTWAVTINKIKEKRDGKLALFILNILAYLDSDNIPVDDIFCLWEKNTEIRHYAVELLNQYSMVYLEGGMLKVHRLVQLVTRIRVEQQGEENGIVQMAYLLLTRNFPESNNTMECYYKEQRLLPQFEVFLKRLNEFADRKPENKEMITNGWWEFVLLGMLGKIYTDIGDTIKQTYYLQRTLDTGIKLFGSNHPKVASSLCNLGIAYRRVGNPMKQLELLEQAKAIYEKNYEPEDIKMALIFTSLATACSELGKPLEQKQYIERALAIRKKHYGPEHPLVIDLKDLLANAYGALGYPYKQKDLLEEVLAAKKTQFGTNHVSYASSLSNLSSVYGEIGQPHKQKELLEQALEILEKFFGSDSFMIASQLTNLGGAYGDLGEYAKQIELLERAHAINEKHFGPNNYKLADTIENMAIVIGNLGKHKKANDLLIRAKSLLEAHYGPGHHEVTRVLVNLGNSYGDLGQPEMKKELLEQALVIHENFFGHEHFHIPKIIVNLGNAYADLGDHKKRKELMERALKINIAHFGPEHVEVAHNLGFLGLAYGALGNHQKGSKFLKRALIMKKKFDSTNNF